MSRLAGTYFTTNFVPFVVDDNVVGEFRCCIPVVPGGDGADTADLEERTDRCPHRTSLFVGRAPTCLHHLALAVRIGGVKRFPAFDARCES